MDNTTHGFRVAAKNLLDPDKDVWETFSPVHRLCMTDSGTSGTLLFEDHSSLKRFSIAVGIHDRKPWCDVITNLPANAKLSIINETYYQSRGGARLR
ncbi:Cytolysin/lectin, partial [Russula earlei]